MADQANTPRRPTRRQEAIGRRYGRLVVLEDCRNEKGTRVYRCRCDCGDETTAVLGNLTSGNTKSCGCLDRERKARTHPDLDGAKNAHKHPLYRRWRRMIKRCYDSTWWCFHRYGGRGITVCDLWRDDFAAFVRDMGPMPSPKHEVDRRDNDGPYSPENCRWSTRKEQARNTGSNRRVEYAGRMMTLAEAAELSGVPYSMAQRRLNAGWPTERAFRR